MSLLEVEHLSFSYEEGKNVLSDVSFSVNEGSYVAIIGHNGSGKSTLAKILMGLLTDYEGKIALFGQAVDKKNVKSLRSRMGIVFQNPDNQFVGSTVEDDIAFGLENRRIPHEEMQPIIEKYAEKVGMSGYLQHEPTSLSGGQKQRVAIAGVLAMKPDLVIFDEATAMLDPQGKKEIASLIGEMRKDNPKLSILSITHDVEEASQADEVLVLDAGKMILQGTPREVFSHQEELEKAQLGIPFFPSLMAALKKEGVDVPPEIQDLDALEAYLCR